MLGSRVLVMVVVVVFGGGDWCLGGASCGMAGTRRSCFVMILVVVASAGGSCLVVMSIAVDGV